MNLVRFNCTMGYYFTSNLTVVLSLAGWYYWNSLPTKTKRIGGKHKIRT